VREVGVSASFGESLFAVVSVPGRVTDRRAQCRLSRDRPDHPGAQPSPVTAPRSARSQARRVTAVAVPSHRDAARVRPPVADAPV
jgi:hypothetical protein